jgi:hypothetical protein
VREILLPNNLSSRRRGSEGNIDVTICQAGDGEVREILTEKIVKYISNPIA